MKIIIIKLYYKIRSQFRTIRNHKLNILIKRGLIIGKNFQFEGGGIIDPINCHLIKIGDDVVFSANVHLLAHDAGLKNQLGLARVGCIEIGNRVFIGLGVIVLPNVTIGDDCIIGAGSVVTKNIPSGSIAVGNPAKVICSMEDYKVRIMKQYKQSPHYEVMLNVLNMTQEEKEKQKGELNNKIGFKHTINHHLFSHLFNDK